MKLLQYAWGWDDCFIPRKDGAYQDYNREQEIPSKFLLAKAEALLVLENWTVREISMQGFSSY